MNPKHCSDCGFALMDSERAKVHPYCLACGVTNWQNARPVVLLLQPVRVPEGMGLAVARRGIMPDKGGFALPGGFVEKGEITPQAAAREFREESGYHIDWKSCRLLADLPSSNGEHQLLFVQNDIVMNSDVFAKLQDTDEMSDWTVRSVSSGPKLCWATHEAVVMHWLDAHGDSPVLFGAGNGVETFPWHFLMQFISD